MADSPSVQFNKHMINIKKAGEDASSPTALRLIGISARDQIVKRTRLGFGVDEPVGQRQKLAALSQSYKDFRNGRAVFFRKGAKILKFKPTSKPKLDGTTRPNKSNLTLTGAMLRSISIFIRGRVIEIAARGRKNKDKVFFAHEGSANRPKRKFLNLTNKETLRVTQVIDKIFDLALNKRLGGS